MSITSGACFLYAFVLHRATGYIELLISIYFSIINIKSGCLFASRRLVAVLRYATEELFDYKMSFV